MLAPPTGLTINDNGEEVAEFDLTEGLRFIIEIGLSPALLINRIDTGPGPRDGDPNFPDTKKQFFEAAFPGSMPIYLVDTSSQSPVGPA